MNNLHTLHNQENTLLLCNIWDANSANLAEQTGFQAIGTSSAAIAHCLGFDDGENISFEQLLAIVERIRAVTTIALTVDIESGYSANPQQVADNIIKLEQLGVQGINIEDSRINRAHNARELRDIHEFSDFMSEVLTSLAKHNSTMFINIRTDTYIASETDNPLQEAQERINIYQNLAIHGIFVPCMIKPENIKTVVASTTLPINIMSMPQAYDIAMLENYGVKRISMGNFLHDAINHLQSTLATIMHKQSLKPLFTC